jgi:hypothetical protein
MINPRYLKKAFDDIFVSRARYIDRPSPVERYFFRKPREDGSPSKEGYYRDVPREERLFYLPELIDRTADGNFGARRVLDAVRKEWGEWHRPPSRREARLEDGVVWLYLNGIVGPDLWSLYKSVGGNPEPLQVALSQLSTGRKDLNGKPPRRALIELTQIVSSPSRLRKHL